MHGGSWSVINHLSALFRKAWLGFTATLIDKGSGFQISRFALFLSRRFNLLNDPNEER
jgi:hypothetical protein